MKLSPCPAWMTLWVPSRNCAVSEVRTASANAASAEWPAQVGCSPSKKASSLGANWWVPAASCCTHSKLRFGLKPNAEGSANTDSLNWKASTTCTLGCVLAICSSAALLIRSRCVGQRHRPEGPRACAFGVKAKSGNVNRMMCSTPALVSVVDRHGRCCRRQMATKVGISAWISAGVFGHAGRQEGGVVVAADIDQRGRALRRLVAVEVGEISGDLGRKIDRQRRSVAVD